MDSFKLSYSEVSTYHLHASSKGEISLDIGANQSTLQDYKLAESVGFYCYKDSNVWSSSTSNRFIYWRSNNDYIQFYETSLDFNLARNHVQLRFHNTPILDGVSVHEIGDHVIILLATVASIHRITLNHPRKLGTVLVDTVRNGSNILPHSQSSINPSDLHTRKSIFYDLNAANLRDPESYHVLNNSFNLGVSLSSSDLPFPVRSCSWLNSVGESYFALADYNGNISIIKMTPCSSGKVTVYNLKQTGLIKSLFYNLVPSVISRGNQENEQAALSILWHRPLSSDDDLMITLCRDLKIRIWSCAKQDYIVVESVLESYQDISSTYPSSLNQKSANDPMIVTRPVLKKDSAADSSDELFLATFVPTASGRKFIIYKLYSFGENLNLKVVTSIDALQEDLVDFAFTQTTLWALWLDAESEVSLSHWEINRESPCWQSVTMYSHFQPPINVKSMLISPKKLFTEKIFKKGKFSSQTIAKAISTLNRTHESYYSCLNTEALIEEVTNAVESRLRNRPGINELSPEFYANLECELWNEFYSYCLQYHNVFNKPLGLFMDSQTGLTGILRVSSVSYLRANDSIDHVLLSQVHSPSYTISNILTDDISLETSLQVLLQFIKTINSYLDEDAFLQLEMCCSSEEPIEQVYRDIANKYLLSSDQCDIESVKSSGLLSSVEDALEISPRLLDAIELVLRVLNLESKDQPDEIMESSTEMAQQSLDQFLSGNIGTCVLTESIKQMCRLRYEFCRDLFLFQLLLRSSTINSTDYERLSDSLENLISINKLCLRSYFSMTWLCETSMSLKDSTFLGIENTVTLLATLELHEFINVNRNPPTPNALVHDFAPKSIIAYLIGHKKCSSARKLLSSRLEDVIEPEDCQTWVAIQPFLVQAIGSIIWPTSYSSYVLRFLLGYEQFDMIDQYSKILDSWCDHSISSRRFVMGITQLFFGEPKKSVGFFHQALHGLLEESFLQKIFLANVPSASSIERKSSDSLTNAEITSYFNKLFRLCRLHSLNDIILDLALGAIDLLDESEASYNQHFSSFMTTIFMCHLEFGNTADAFCSMLLNPSPIQRKDCLRQFTVKLYEKQAIAEMINYRYDEMEDDFISILEFRARSTDLLQTEKKVDFYEILYAYFVKGDNYRKSASIIYEYAKRLCQEVNGVESLKKQARCLLLAINSLKLIDPKYAWIIQPTIKVAVNLPYGRSTSSVSSSIKRKHGLDDVQESQTMETMTCKEIQVLSIEDIEKEYELTNARYKLLEKSVKLNSIASTPLSAEETVTILISNLLFDLAFQLSTRFNLPYEPILEGLVSKYVYLTELPFRKMSLEAGLMEINECFIENDTASLSFIANAEMPAIDKLLFLILAYIEKYEQGKQSRLHKCVAEKLLESGIPLPAPLKLSYQKRNSPELLFILMSYDYIEDAYNFSLELIDGYLGQGTEYFDIQAPVMGSKQIVYFPHQHIKCLLKILDTEKEDSKDYEEFSKQLREKWNKYKELIQSCHQITSR
ncbi:nuclear pore complex protein Nup160-like [Panonychus citri]|uniref:nuclear pore complex protein Nup160-like n=1 Tax=Panonychus citri TaxID=50023 RepID=UPI0023079793|nr:nuclear pore complex protein Nup160-like [Panonychus citri]